MPYVDGKRISNEEWTARFGSIQKLHTGPNGENPATQPDLDPETHAPVQKQAGKRRSARSTAKVNAAIAFILLDISGRIPFGGASILIVVGVGLETVKQIESQLQQRHYEGFLR